MFLIRLYLKKEGQPLNVYNKPFGYVFRGVFLNWLNDISPSSSHKFHEYEEVREYAINVWIKEKQNEIVLSLTLDDDVLGTALVDYIIQNPFISIIEEKYQITGIEKGAIDLKEILQNSKPIKSFNLFFPLPCYFNTSFGDYPVRLPIPESIYTNLCNIWNAISEGSADNEREAFSSWVRVHVYLSSCNIRTEKGYIGKNRTIAGFMGNASYRIKKPNIHYFKKIKKIETRKEILLIHEGFSRWVDFLNKMAEYTNMGVNRTASFGIVKYQPKEYL